jgi:hypothetical protein
MKKYKKEEVVELDPEITNQSGINEFQEKYYY